MDDLSSQVGALWERREQLSTADGDALVVVDQAIDLLDTGEARVAEIDPETDEVIVHEWLRQAILLLFILSGVRTIEHGPFEYTDKLALKHGLQAAGVRAVPGASARRGAFLGRGVVLMPSYVNIGARVGADTMVDTWATVGSCAQVGERPNARPVVIEDDVLIGSRSMVTQGARVGQGAVLGEGTILNPSIPVFDAWSGDELGRGYVPPWSVGVGAMRRRQYPSGEFFLPCVLVVRKLTPGERHDKALLNEILREHEASA
jgi:2,3,4,5-tetrahydropyridine-2-carboxylate N-succinyltransferase